MLGFILLFSGVVFVSLGFIYDEDKQSNLHNQIIEAEWVDNTPEIKKEVFSYDHEGNAKEVLLLPEAVSRWY